MPNKPAPQAPDSGDTSLDDFGVRHVSRVDASMLGVLTEADAPEVQAARHRAMIGKKPRPDYRRRTKGKPSTEGEAS